MVNYKRDTDSLFSGINIVPFTDIVLVLLIIFMIAAPGLAGRGISVKLPGSSSSGRQKTVKIVITLTEKGEAYFNNEKLGSEALQRRIAKEAARNPKLTVILNADLGARHGRVIEMLDAIRSSGAKRVYVGTVEK